MFLRQMFTKLFTEKRWTNSKNEFHCQHLVLESSHRICCSHSLWHIQVQPLGRPPGGSSLYWCSSSDGGQSLLQRIRQDCLVFVRQLGHTGLCQEERRDCQQYLMLASLDTSIKSAILSVSTAQVLIVNKYFTINEKMFLEP